jgi:hypothetical protein
MPSGMKTPCNYKLAGLHLKSKEAVKTYIQTEILPSYEDMEDISILHFKFMMDLLQYHPKAESKIGLGVRRIWIQTKNGTRSFWLEKLDGTISTLSYYQCLECDEKLKDFKAAARKAITEEITEFKRDFFRQCNGQATCPITGERIYARTSQVEHVIPFDRLVNAFQKLQKLNLDEGVTDEVLKRWVEYHKQHAKLRIISSFAKKPID